MCDSCIKSRADYVKTVSTPGKFEGEPAYVPYFWEYILDTGSGDDEIWENDVPVDVLIVDKHDRTTFPELADVEVVLIWENDQGFVLHRDFATEGAYDDWRRKMGL